MKTIKYIIWVLIFIASVAALLFILSKLDLVKFTFFDDSGKEEIVESTVLLKEVTALGKMELVKYELQEVVTFKKKQFLMDKKALVKVSAECVGCIDFQKITETQIESSAEKVIITLPAPEICYYKIDHKNSKVVQTSGTLFGGEKELIDKAYTTIEKGIPDKAIDMGILDETMENANKIVKPMLEKIAGKPVEFRYETVKKKME